MEILIYYIIIINIISIFTMFIDKRKAQKDKWRIKENYIHLLSVLGAASGTIVGMLLFHHKTKKKKFCLITGACFIINVLVLDKVILEII